jgi:16S rRNA (guanine966-N2)-methyltransferase
MRIIAGALKGHTFSPPTEKTLRPTTDRVREGIFNTLHSLCEIEGTVVLDLFAGSGGLGFEALSRGAKHCCFIENNRRMIGFLKETAQKFKVVDRTQIISGDCPPVLENLNLPTCQIIFADPPYGQQLRLGANFSKILDNGSLFVFETSKRAKEPLELDSSLSLELVKDKHYGETNVKFYRYQI